MLKLCSEWFPQFRGNKIVYRKKNLLLILQKASPKSVEVNGPAACDRLTSKITIAQSVDKNAKFEDEKKPGIKVKTQYGKQPSF